MTEEQWEQIKFFDRNENWGSPESMDYHLVWLLDKIRKEVGKPFIIHCGFGEEGHVPKSYHKQGKAVDFHVHGIGLYTAWEEINKMWWMGGAGIYPAWNNPGFHLDIGTYRRWYQNKGGRYFNIVNGVFEEEII